MTGSGNVTVSAGEIKLYDGRLFWTESDPNGSQSVKIGTLTPPAGTKVGGIALQGDLSLSFNNAKGADITGDIALPFGSLAKGLSINGTVELHCKPGVGLLHDQLKITKDNFQLYGVGVKNLSVSYSPTDDIWEGSAEVSLPTPNKLDISADLAFQHGGFHKFSGSADNINFPILDGIYVQKISVVFGLDPTTVGGGLGVSFGPTVDGKQLVRVDGSFVYQAATATAAGFVDVSGTLTLASFKIANAYFNYYTTGEVQFGGHLQLGLPDATASSPQHQPVYIDASLNGAIYGSQFDVDIDGRWR